ncbi:MAG: phosphoribosyltransferase family protein [Nitrospirota bacterium]
MAGRLLEDRTLRDRRFIFRDRVDAGRRLAEFLRAEARGDELVLGIPAGGVPVGYALMKGLGLAFDLLVVRKLRIPGNPEAGFGALAPDGRMVLNDTLLRGLGLGREDIEREAERTRKVMEHRNETYRHGRPFPDVRGRRVIVTDDGLASGYTMLAALGFLGRRGAGSLVVAVPTASLRTVRTVQREADLVACLNVRSGFPFAVAEAYMHWHDLTDEEVMDIVDRSRQTQGG